VDALLRLVLDAHGGLDHWRSLTTLTARITYGGPFWAAMGRPDFVGVDRVEADLKRQRFHQVQESTGRTVVHDKAADLVTVTAADGTVLEELLHPRSTFPRTLDTTWTVAQAAYFRSYATWHYLVEPHLFTWDGVEAHEVDPWTEGDRTWRVLRVTFPDTIDTHSRTQRYYFEETGLLRRMDYDTAVVGDVPVAHYIRDERAVDGVVVPTKRHIHLRNPDGTPDLSWVSITVDLDDVALR